MSIFSHSFRVSQLDNACWLFIPSPVETAYPENFLIVKLSKLEYLELPDIIPHPTCSPEGLPLSNADKSLSPKSPSKVPLITCAS